MKISAFALVLGLVALLAACDKDPPQPAAPAPSGSAATPTTTAPAASGDQAGGW
ncbi:MAG: hypothetical protein KIT84_20430 [Labilithrix sp.]|nr:hypothetical protein [Labilithrix sp.]MCW5813407.1 hypothetical protein [Labilithrix sp.]